MTAHFNSEALLPDLASTICKREASTPYRRFQLRSMLNDLKGHEDALIRSAAGISIRELDLADLNPTQANDRLRQVGRILDAVLNPEAGE